MSLLNKNLEYYNASADHYDHLYHRESLNHKIRLERMLKGLALTPGESVLEIGVGTGLHAEGVLRQHGVRFFGVDVSEGMLEVSRARLKTFAHVDLRLADAHQLPFEDQSLDKVYICGVLHHLDDPARALRECYRVLKKGGKIAITEPNRFFFMNIIYGIFMPSERGTFQVSLASLGEWLKQAGFRAQSHEHYLFTPGKPKLLHPLYRLINENFGRIPLLKHLSIMIYIEGIKT